MNSRQYEYGSPALRNQVKALLSKPSPYVTQVRAKAVAQLFSRDGNRFICPVTEYVDGPFGIRPKGTRADSLIVENLRTAIITGRASLLDVQQVLSAMYGEEHANAWDGVFQELAELFRQASS